MAMNAIQALAGLLRQGEIRQPAQHSWQATPTTSQHLETLSQELMENIMSPTGDALFRSHCSPSFQWSTIQDDCQWRADNLNDCLKSFREFRKLYPGLNFQVFNITTTMMNFQDGYAIVSFTTRSVGSEIPQQESVDSLHWRRKERRWECVKRSSMRGPGNVWP